MKTFTADLGFSESLENSIEFSGTPQPAVGESCVLSCEVQSFRSAGERGTCLLYSTVIVSLRRYRTGRVAGAVVGGTSGGITISHTSQFSRAPLTTNAAPMPMFWMASLPRWDISAGSFHLARDFT